MKSGSRNLNGTRVFEMEVQIETRSSVDEDENQKRKDEVAVPGEEEVEPKRGLEERDKEIEEQNANVLQFLDSVDDYLNLMDNLYSTLREGWLDLASARHSMGISRISGSLLDLKLHSAATTLRINQHQHDENDHQLHSQLYHRGGPQDHEKAESDNETTDTVDARVQKERSKTLSMFGAFVSPKLRSAQLSFETALETLVQIANKRSTMLCAFEELRDKL